MILSHQHKFLFIHIPKTGGSSLRRALNRATAWEAYYVPLQIVRRVCQLTTYRIGSVLPRHGCAVAARDTVMLEHFLAYHKFAFVRNPWDRLVSSFKHLERERQDVLGPRKIRTFHEYCDWVLNPDLGDLGRRTTLIHGFRRTQTEYLTDHDGKPLMDFVGRFERLESDFERILARLNLSASKLGHRRRSQRVSDYRCYYDDHTAELTAHFYRRDLELFGYEFDQPQQNNAAA